MHHELGDDSSATHRAFRSEQEDHGGWEEMGDYRYPSNEYYLLGNFRIVRHTSGEEKYQEKVQGSPSLVCICASGTVLVT